MSRQIVVRCASGITRQVPQGTDPQAKVLLGDEEHLHEFTWVREITHRDRKTADWAWAATIIRPLRSV